MPISKLLWKNTRLFSLHDCSLILEILVLLFFYIFCTGAAVSGLVLDYNCFNAVFYIILLCVKT